MAAFRLRGANCPLKSRFATCPSFLGHVVMVFLSLLQLSSQQEDPVANFCRRFGHQSAVVDRQLIIDGGLVNWNPISANPGNYSNTWLLYNDLNSVNNAGMPQLYANLSKNGSIPDVSGGILWADDVNKRVYLFGGETYQSPPSSIFNLLAYDPIYNIWNSFGQPSTKISNVAWGAGATVPDRGEGYYYGGWISNTTTAGYVGNPVGSTSLVKYDMVSNQFQNFSGPDDIPRAEGVMVYIPASDRGLLIYFGGVNMPYFNSTVNASSMNDIHIYDIASSQWYLQEASGNTPNPRRRFCAGAAWAPDRSSYNIYLYGGAGFAPNEIGYDDVYILSLPSFTWIKWYPTTTNSPGRPHGSLTCNVIDGAQMLIIGGTFPNDTDCDAPLVAGTHNLDLGKQNVDNAMWHAYEPNITSYIVPPEIISQVGGNSLGSATVTAPSAWGNQDLSVYFTRQATLEVRTPTRAIPTSTSTGSTLPTSTSTGSSSHSSRKLAIGAIVGIAVGGAAILVLMAIGCLCIARKRRNRRLLDNPQTSQYPQQHNPNIQSPQYPPHSGMQSPQYYVAPQTPYSPQPYAQPFPVELSGYQTPHLQHISMEPKYDSVAGDAMRHDSIQHEQQAAFASGGWHSHSPHPSQQYPTPSESPHPTGISPASEPSELGTGRMQQQDPNQTQGQGRGQTSPTPTYSSLGRKPVPPGDRMYS